MKNRLFSMLAVTLVLASPAALGQTTPQTSMVRGYSGNNPPSINWPMIFPPFGTANLATAVIASTIAKSESEVGYFSPTQVQTQSLFDALKFADDCAYFALEEKLERHAVHLSTNPASAMDLDSFSELLKIAHYLAETGRLASARLIYENQLKTIADFGVPPLLRFALRLEYLKFLHGVGALEEAASVAGSVNSSAEWLINPGCSSGLMEWSLPYPDVTRELMFHDDVHFWAPPQKGMPELTAPQSAQRVEPKYLKALYTSDIGQDREWQDAYLAWQAIKKKDWKRSSVFVSKLTINKADAYKQNTSVSRFVNIAKLLAESGQLTTARKLLSKIIRDDTDLETEENRAEILFELAYLSREKTGPKKRYWEQFEQSLTKQQGASLGTISDAAQTKVKETRLIDYLMAEARLYQSFEDPQRSLFILERLQDSHKLDKYNEAKILCIKADCSTQLKDYKQTTSLLNQLINSIDSTESNANDLGLADSVELLRLNGQSASARAILEKRLGKPNATSEPLNFQLGMLDLQDHNFTAAEKEFRKDIDSQLIDRGAKGTIEAALIDLHVRKQNYDVALAELTDDRSDGVIAMSKEQRLKFLFEILPHMNIIDEKTAVQIASLIFSRQPSRDELGPAQAAKTFSGIVAQKAQWCSRMHQSAKEWATYFFPEESFAKADQKAREAEELANLSGHSLIRRGQMLLEMGLPDEAIVYFHEGIKKDGTIEYPIFEHPLKKLNRAADIEALFKARIRKNPSRESSELAGFYIREKRLSDAKAIADVGLKVIAPESPELLQGGVDVARNLYGMLQNIASDYLRHDFNSEARALAKEILKSQEAWLGKYNMSIAETLRIDASAAEKMGDKLGAIQDHQRILEISRFLLGAQNPLTIETKTWLEANGVKAYDGADENKQAHAFHSQKLNQRVAQLASQKDWTGAKDCLNAESKFFKLTDGRLDDNAALITAQLATVDFLQGNKTDCATMLDQASTAVSDSRFSGYKQTQVNVYRSCLSLLLGDKQKAKKFADLANTDWAKKGSSIEGCVFSLALSAVYKKLDDSERSTSILQHTNQNAVTFPVDIIQYLLPYLQD